MPSDTQLQLIQEVHASHGRLVMAVTGGGSGAISALLAVPGASKSVLAATVPYASEALVEWLGARPEEFCSDRTARAMAMVAYLKALAYHPEAPHACGLACTSSLASDRPKRGPHRAHLAFQTATTTATHFVELEKGRRTRGEEEAVVTSLMLNLVAEACGIKNRLDVPLLQNESLLTASIVAPSAQQDLLAGRTRAIQVAGAGGTTPPKAILPGAFDPLHEGHQKMAALAQRILGVEVAFEISIENVDKPPLDFIEMHKRVAQFAPGQCVWLSRAPHFSVKAELFPGATFVVGADTIERVGLARYYGGQEAAMRQAVEHIAAQRCRFLVFGRTVDGTFRTVGDLQIPEPLAQLCREVPADEFRDDISSTQLRAQARAS